MPKFHTITKKYYPTSKILHFVALDSRELLSMYQYNVTKAKYLALKKNL